MSNKLYSLLAKFKKFFWPKHVDPLMETTSTNIVKPVYTMNWISFKMNHAYSEQLIGTCSLKGDYVIGGILSKKLVKVDLILKNALKEYNIGSIHGCGIIYTEKRYDILAGNFDVYIRAKELKSLGKIAIYDGL